MADWPKLDGTDRGRVDDTQSGFMFELGVLDSDNANTPLPQEVAVDFDRDVEQTFELPPGALKGIKVLLRLKANAGLDANWTFEALINDVVQNTEVVAAGVNEDREVLIDVQAFAGQTVKLTLRLKHQNP